MAKTVKTITDIRYRESYSLTGVLRDILWLPLYILSLPLLPIQGTDGLIRFLRSGIICPAWYRDHLIAERKRRIAYEEAIAKGWTPPEEFERSGDKNPQAADMAAPENRESAKAKGCGESCACADDPTSCAVEEAAATDPYTQPSSDVPATSDSLDTPDANVAEDVSASNDHSVSTDSVRTDSGDNTITSVSSDVRTDADSVEGASEGKSEEESETLESIQSDTSQENSEAQEDSTSSKKPKLKMH